MLTCARICLLALLLGASLRATAGQPLMFITEAYPPYNFSDDNILRGIAVDLLVIASLNTEQPVQRGQIRLMPWARAYRTALHTPNSVLFATTRTAERERRHHHRGRHHHSQYSAESHAHRVSP